MEANLKNDKIKYVNYVRHGKTTKHSVEILQFSCRSDFTWNHFLQNGGKQNTKFRGARIVIKEDFETLTYSVEITEIYFHSFLAKNSWK